MKKYGQEKTGAYKKLSQSIADRRSKLQSKQKMIYDPAAKKDKEEKKKEVKKEGLTMMLLGKEVELKEKCWKGYEKKGMKTMFGKRYPNCVKKEEVEIEEKKMVKVKLNPEKKNRS